LHNTIFKTTIASDFQPPSVTITMIRLPFNAALLLALLLVGPAITSSVDGNGVDDGEENPFLEAAKSLLQDSLASGQGGGAGGLGSVLQSFMQTEGAKSGLGSIVSGLAAAKGSVDPQMIGQLVGMFAGGATADKSSSGNDDGPGVDWSSMIDLASGKSVSVV
jgi:hypothetical protein